MANRYLVAGGSGLWNATDTNNWSATSGGASGASCPTSSDDVFLDAGSAGASIDCQATATAANVDCTGFTGTFSWGGAVSTTWGGSWTFSAGMTVNGVAFSTQVFTGTGTHTITSAGKQFGNFTINSSGGSYTLQDALTVGASGTATLTFTRGTLDTNGNTVAAGGFSSNNSNTRTLTLGASALNMSTTAPWNVGTTNLTLTANTSVVTCSASGASFITWQTFNWNGMSLVFTGGVANFGVSTNLTFANLTFTGTAVKTNALTLFGDITTTGAFTINGNSVTNRVLVNTNTIATTRTVTAATVSVTNADFQDITGAGAGSWNLSAISGGSGDCGGNSGITFTTPVTRYGVVAGNWSNTATWSSTSGGGGGSSVPLCHDTVILDASSAAGTYTVDMPRMCADLTCTGFTRTLATTTNTIYGSLTLGAGMTYSPGSSITLSGRGTHTVTSAGKTWAACSFIAPSGSYTFQDAFTTTSTLLHNWGTLAFNGQTITASTFTVSANGTRTLNMTNSTLNLTATGAGAIWTQGSTGLTLVSTGSTIAITGASANARTFAGGGLTYGTLTYTVTASTGSLTLTGSNTFNTINFSDSTNARSLLFTAATNTTVTNWNVNGFAGNLITIDSATAATHTLTKSGGTLSSDYLSVKNSTGAGTVPLYAGANSTNVSGNTNWTFTAPPSGSSKFMLMGVG